MLKVSLIFAMGISCCACAAVDMSSVNPEQMGGHFEGDIILPPSSEALIGESVRWPGGVIPYVYEDDYPRYAKFQVRRAMNEFQKYTCIRFRNRTSTDKDYIVIKNSVKPECSSYMGRRGGPQDIMLTANSCTAHLGTVIHELMHALGFYHEQSRKDRDEHISINYDNIKQGMEHNFAISRGKTSTFGVKYNPKSVMHYPFNAFSVNASMKTIEPKNKKISWAEVGQRVSFSNKDLLQIIRMYECPKDERFDFEQEEEEE